MKTSPKHGKATGKGEPRARKDDLIIKEMPDEVLIYDLTRDKAHCLNRTAAMVWNYCDGRTSAAVMAGRLNRELDTTVDERVVWLALDQLSRNNLLEEKVAPPSVVPRINRREMIRALGVGVVVAIPVVTSIVAPTPVQAGGSCLGSGAACCSSGQCCSGICSGGDGCNPNPGTCG